MPVVEANAETSPATRQMNSAESERDADVAGEFTEQVDRSQLVEHADERDDSAHQQNCRPVDPGNRLVA